MKKQTKLPKNIRKLPIFGRMSLTKAQEKELDSLWSDAVKERAGRRCEYCCTASGLDSHHVIGRKNKAVRHIVSNGCCLCSGHHMNFAHQNSGAFHDWIVSSRGVNWWNDLQAQSKYIKVFKEYLVIKKYLESYL